MVDPFENVFYTCWPMLCDDDDGPEEDRYVVDTVYRAIVLIASVAASRGRPRKQAGSRARKK